MGKDSKNSKFYDGTKLLSLKDIDGKTPEIYMVTTNRTGGKTTYFGRLAVNRFLKYKEKFCLLYRFNYELDGVADKFFKDIGKLFFPDYYLASERMANRFLKYKEKFCLLYRFNYELDGVADKFFKDIGKLFFPDYYLASERMASGIFHVLYLYKLVPNEDGVLEPDPDTKECCGYAITLNSADQIKKYSHFFSDVQRIIFDEFQSETDHYCSNEVKKFLSIHTSIARGQGEQSRYVPVYMLSNPVSLINPYYVAMGISSRLSNETKFLRGKGFVLEQGHIDSATKAQKSSAFFSAFSDDKYTAYSSEGVYLNDQVAFIEKMSGRSTYICTFKYNGQEFGVREFPDDGVIYCDDKPDETFKTKISVTTDDHEVNYIMLKKNDLFLDGLKYAFRLGRCRFKNLLSKECFMTAITYSGIM